MIQSTDKTRRHGGAVIALASAVILSACAGENLFSLAASLGEVGPEVTIEAPGEGFTAAVGAAVVVQANGNAPAGARVLTITGRYAESGDPAYGTVTDNNLTGAAVAINETLQAVDGQTDGSVYIVVEVTDQAGEVGRDSVRITVVS